MENGYGGRKIGNMVQKSGEVVVSLDLMFLLGAFPFKSDVPAQRYSRKPCRMGCLLTHYLPIFYGGI